MMKIVSPTVAHKMAVNGVRSVYRDLDFLKYSCERLQQEVAALGHPVEGILLVDHIPYTKDLGNEVLLGFRESDAFGPVISFSKGGTDAEHFAEHFSPPNLILAPIDEAWARALLQSTKIYKKYLKDARRTPCRPSRSGRCPTQSPGRVFFQFFRPIVPLHSKRI